MPLINLPHPASNRSHVRRASIILIAVLLLVVQRPSHPVQAANAPFLVKDINTGISTTVPEGVYPQNLVAIGSRLYFSAYSESSGVELWASDGTAAGTELVKDIAPGWRTSNAAFLTDVNGTLFFIADDGSHGCELWKSDGTANGTVMVKDINPGVDSSAPPVPLNPELLTSELTVVGETLFFVAAVTEEDYELWKSDGTAEGTTLVKDIVTGSRGSWPYELTGIDGTLFFATYSSDRGQELWKSDGTPAGTVVVSPMLAGNSNLSIFALAEVDGLLFFGASSTGQNAELWKSDGTAAGTAPIKEIMPGNLGSSPAAITDVSGIAFFAAAGPAGRELWRSDGTEAGTTMIADINPDAGHAFQ
jgi:ELWxxDGT repeat protein